MDNSMLDIYSKITRSIPTLTYHDLPDELSMEISTMSLCSLNRSYLDHALQALEQNTITTSTSLIRSAYESIPKIIYWLSHPEHIKYILCKEVFDLWFNTQKTEDMIKKTKKLNKEEYLQKFLETDGHEWVNDKNTKFGKMLLDIHNQFTNEWYRKQVYVGESLHIQKYRYGSLSRAVHANVLSIHWEHNYEQSKDILKMLNGLACFNLILYTSACYKSLEEKNELDDTIKFLQKTCSQLKGYPMFQELLPNIPKYLEPLVIHQNWSSNKYKKI